MPWSSRSAARSGRSATSAATRSTSPACTASITPTAMDQPDYSSIRHACSAGRANAGRNRSLHGDAPSADGATSRTRRCQTQKRSSMACPERSISNLHSALRHRTRSQRVFQRARRIGDAIAPAVRDHHAALRQLRDRFARRQPRRQRHHRPNVRPPPPPATRSGPPSSGRRGTDGDIAMAAGDLVHRPLHVRHRIALVVSAHAVSKLAGGDAATAGRSR